MTLKVLFIILILTHQIYTQICYGDKSICEAHSTCDKSLGVCKCNDNFYGNRCQEIILNPSLLLKGIRPGDVTLIITICTGFWVLSLFLGIISIVFCTRQKVTPVSFNQQGSQYEIASALPSQIAKIDSIHMHHVSSLERQLENLKLFLSNLELELNTRYDENKAINNVITNIKDFINFNTKPNKMAISTIYTEIQKIFTIIQNNNTQFANFNTNRFIRRLREIQSHDTGNIYLQVNEEIKEANEQEEAEDVNKSLGDSDYNIPVESQAKKLKEKKLSVVIIPEKNRARSLSLTALKNKIFGSKKETTSEVPYSKIQQTESNITERTVEADSKVDILK